MGFFTYILKSESTGTYYYGSTADIEARCHKHNKGKVRYTKSKRPWVLHYCEEYETRSEAYKRELYFKSMEGYRFLRDGGIVTKTL